jgi:hypothetical protein
MSEGTRTSKAIKGTRSSDGAKQTETRKGTEEAEGVKQGEKSHWRPFRIDGHV